MPSSINPLCVPMLTVGRLFISLQGFHGFSVPCGVIYVTHCIFLNMKCPIHQAYDWLKRHHVATTSQEKIDCNLKPYSNNIFTAMAADTRDRKSGQRVVYSAKTDQKK